MSKKKTKEFNGLDYLKEELAKVNGETLLGKMVIVDTPETETPSEEKTVEVADKPKTKETEPTWKLDKTSNVLHIQCEGYEGLIQIYVNGKRQPITTKLTDGQKSIQLSGPLPADELYIEVVKLKK